jgi:phage head maturation protease
MHDGDKKGEIVESIVLTREVQDALGISLDKIGWFVGFKVYDDEVWAKVKSGELRMLSIGGRGTRHDVSD